jgi:hypothetical protein
VEERAFVATLLRTDFLIGNLVNHNWARPPLFFVSVASKGLRFAVRGYSLLRMDSAAVEFGAVSLGLGLLTFVVLVAAWGGVGTCTDMRQLALLFLALAGTLIGRSVLLFPPCGVCSEIQRI